MTDRYEHIRKALEMEPTPGPRRVIDGDSYPYVTVALPENEGRRWNDPIICTLYEALYEGVTPNDYIGFGECLQEFPNACANAALIAACDPDTIRELIKERDALAAEVERLQADPGDEVVFYDGVGAGRSSVKSCHDGVQWIRVGNRVYWPLSDSDAKRLHSACCGNGSFDGPTTPAEGEKQ